MGMSADAELGWGVTLVDEHDETHESLEDVDLWDEIESNEFDSFLEYARGGYDDYGYPVIMIKRTYTCAYGYQPQVVDPEKFIPPTAKEIEKLNEFLDKIGFTGDRSLKLYLVPSYG